MALKEKIEVKEGTRTKGEKGDAVQAQGVQAVDTVKAGVDIDESTVGVEIEAGMRGTIVEIAAMVEADMTMVNVDVATEGHTVALRGEIQVRGAGICERRMIETRGIRDSLSLAMSKTKSLIKSRMTLFLMMWK